LKALEHFRNVFFELRPLHWHVLPSTSSACAAAIARSIGGPPASNRITVSQVFLLLLHQPAKYLLHRWNWKSALLSSLIRAGLFFATNVAAGFPAALAAMKTELVFRGVTSGFYGALTQAFREAEPAWAAAIAVMILLPLANHSLELFVHWMRGTQKLLPSIGASMVLTVFSTLFNFYVMRRGTLIVGAGRTSLATDLFRIPRHVLDFLTWLPRYLIRRSSRTSKSDWSHGH
jgi:hypothetical protein